MAALAAALFSSVSAHAQSSEMRDWLKTPDWNIQSTDWLKTPDWNVRSTKYDFSNAPNFVGDDPVWQSCKLDHTPHLQSAAYASFHLYENDDGSLHVAYNNAGSKVKWTGPVSIVLQIDDKAPWSGQVMPFKSADDGPFSSVDIPIQHPLMDEFHHGTQVKFTANGHTQAFSLGGEVAEMAFRELDSCAASIMAERVAHMPLQKGRALVTPLPALGVGSRADAAPVR
jgi:hypothetical protein